MKYTALDIAGVISFAENRAVRRPTGCYKEEVTQYPARIYSTLLNGLQALPIESVKIQPDGVTINYGKGAAFIGYAKYPEYVKAEILKIVSPYESLV